jgi:hypothetical protein
MTCYEQENNHAKDALGCSLGLLASLSFLAWTGNPVAGGFMFCLLAFLVALFLPTDEPGT